MSAIYRFIISYHKISPSPPGPATKRPRQGHQGHHGHQGDLVDLANPWMDGIPSGYVKIAIENGHL